MGSGSSETLQGRLGAWTEAKKERILSSRRDGTALLVRTILGLKNPPKVRVCECERTSVCVSIICVAAWRFVVLLYPGTAQRACARTCAYACV